MKTIDLVYRTMFAELTQRSLDASFETDFPTSGNFVKVPVKAHDYWYFDDTTPGSKRRYVGPVADEQITGRVERFRDFKTDLRARRKLVSTLVREAGLPEAERFTGDVIEALEKAGFFRLRGVLVGTAAFQAYAGHLGVRLPGALLQTGDADFAQFHSISAAVGDTLPPIMEVLREVDPSFRVVPHLTDAGRATQYENAARFKVEFLTPNTGSDDHGGHASPMPALGGASAAPLRFLDFLIHEPVRTVLLHRSGVPVIVPDPARYAVHKLIVAARRKDAAKRDKDLHQAGVLAEALAVTRRQDDLELAFGEAMARGPAWREAIKGSLKLLDDDTRARFGEAQVPE